MKLEQELKKEVAIALKAVFGLEEDVVLQATRKEFEGNFTYVFFPLVKSLRKSPVEIGKILGEQLISNSNLIANYNVIQGFLNIVLKPTVWLDVLKEINEDENWGQLTNKNEPILVEFSSPNTNKPLHLGHLRNNFLGDSVSKILAASGLDVTKACLVNDRGIHICKSMLAYQKFGENETPESASLKGDHFVGKYYVKFDQALKLEIQELVNQGIDPEVASKTAPIMQEVAKMLLKWEENDLEIKALWAKMNQWVYDGFSKTYTNLRIEFDKTYYESDTYLLGKEVVEQGLIQNVFFQKPDSSIWIDLKEEKLDEKLVLRKDGTSVYITQDLGTTDLKFKDFPAKRSIWVVGNEQDYHFNVLFAIMKKLGRDYADGCFHLSYGMVDLPSGKMKSREGTVVDADDLLAEMIETAKNRTLELGKVNDFDEAEREELYKMLALGALKYYLLKVDPKKRMLFNPEESIDFQGNTGPFIQYTHARIASIQRRVSDLELDLKAIPQVEANAIENELIYLIAQFPKAIEEAANSYSPAVMAQYVYDLAKTFNQFYNEVSILKAENEELMKFRAIISKMTSKTIKASMKMLGIDVPERM